MVDYLVVPVAVVYLIVIGLLFVYGINFFYLTYQTQKKKPLDPDPPPVEKWPFVTVQLPIYNELYVAERLIEAAARLDYPRRLLEIQVLDDSTDETADLVRQTVERLSSQGVQIVHLRREQRTGFKAGALGEGLRQAKGEYLAIFDADFVPGPDFLRRSLPYLIHSTEEKAGPAFIQARWGHLNRDYSFLTLLQSLAIDAHFKIEQYARSLSGFWFNFNGTAGIWRRQAIEEAGGWKADTLTEDLDLSYRAFLKGWDAVYLDEIEVPAELPVSFTAYRRQQHRWARGSLECAARLIPQVWVAPVPLAKKVAATLHLTGYGIHLLMLTLSLLYPLILLISHHYPTLISLFGITAMFNLTAFAPTLFNIVSQRRLGRPWQRMLPAILFMSALGAGMMVNTLRAAVQALHNRAAVFERTPKFAIARRSQSWMQRRYQVRLDPLVFAEMGFAMVNAGTILLAISMRNYVIALYAALFFTGLCFTSGVTLAQTFSVYRKNLGQSKDSEAGVQAARNGTGADGASRSIEMPPSVSLKSPQAPHLGYRLSQLEQAILWTVAYADGFDYPLTEKEIHRYLIEYAARPEEVYAALHSDRLAPRFIVRRGAYYLLRGREQIPAIRQRRARSAKRLWPQAERYGRIMARMPFVRMVAVTGALAMNNVENRPDIDYLLAAEPERVWLCRAFAIAVVRLALKGGITLCPNYIISTESLGFRHRTLYTAHEVAQMAPVAGLEVYGQLREANSWTRHFLPNAEDRPDSPISVQDQPPSLLARVGERALKTTPGAWLETWEMQRKIIKFQQQHPDQAESDFCAAWCKGHFAGHGQHAMAAFESRQAKLRDKVEPVRLG